MSGVAPADAPGYAKLGVAPLVAKSLEQAGLTPDQLAAWEAIEPPQFATPYGREDPIDAFSAYKSAGVSPSEVEPFVALGMDLSNWNLILKAIALNHAGYSYQRSVKYAEAGIGPDQVAAYQQQQRHAAEVAAEEKAAAEQAAAAAASQQAQAQQFIQQNCGGQVLSNTDLLNASPYTITGKCYQLGQFTVSQWINATQALADDFTLMIDSDTPIPGQNIGPGIFLGEDPYQYDNTFGSSETVYRLKEIQTQNVVAPSN